MTRLAERFVVELALPRERPSGLLKCAVLVLAISLTATSVAAFDITSQSGRVALSGESITKITEYCCDTSVIDSFVDAATTADLGSWTHALATPPAVGQGTAMGGSASLTSQIDANRITISLTSYCAPISSGLYFKAGYGEAIDASRCSSEASLTLGFNVTQPTTYSFDAGIWLYLRGYSWPDSFCCQTFGQYTETVELIDASDALVASFQPIDCFDFGLDPLYQLHSCPASLGAPPVLPQQQVVGELAPGSYTLRLVADTATKSKWYGDLGPSDPEMPYPPADEHVQILQEVSLELNPVQGEVPALGHWARAGLIALLLVAARSAHGRRTR